MPLLTIRRQGAEAPDPRGRSVVRDHAGQEAPFLPQTILDRIAPTVVEETRESLRLEDSYAAGLAVKGLPRKTTPGWLRDVFNQGEPFDLSFDVRPIASETALRFLDRQATIHGAANRFGASRGRINDTDQDTALEDAQGLRMPVHRNEERLFRVSIYGLVRANSPAALRSLGDRVAGHFRRAGVYTRRTILQQRAAFRSCLPQLTNELDDQHYLSTSALATLLPWSATRLSMPGGVLWGLAGGTNTPIRINLFHNPPQPTANELRLVDANVAVFAQIGSGKSFLLKLLIRRGLPRGCDYVVVDAEDQKEYRALCDDLGGQYVRLGAGSHVRINPLELPPYDPDDDDLQDPLKDHIGSLLRLLELMLADRGQPLSGDEQAILDLALGATYATTWTDPDGSRRGGFTTDPATHRLERTPLLVHLLKVLSDPDQHLSALELEPLLVRSLATRLARYVQGSLADLFSGPTNVELDTPLTVFNVAGLSENLRALGIHLISNFVWTKVRRDHVLGSRRPLQLVVDELWWTLRSPEGGQFLDLMARKARKYWLGLVCASQSPADCLESHYGPAIVNNSRTWVLLGLVSKALEAARMVMKLTDREAATLEHAQPGHALVLCRTLPRAVRLFLTVRASAEEEWINSTTPAELAERNRERRAQQPPAAAATPDPAPAFPTFRPTSSALSSSKRSSDLFEDLEPDDDAPIRFQPRRSRP